jgi:hypothetical protein
MNLTFPELAVIAGTRGLLGVGLGLLLAGRLTRQQRRAIGWPLFVTGALSSVPILVHLMRKSSPGLPAAAEQTRIDAEQAVPLASV